MRLREGGVKVGVLGKLVRAEARFGVLILEMFCCCFVVLYSVPVRLFIVCLQLGSLCVEQCLCPSIAETHVSGLDPLRSRTMCARKDRAEEAD